METNNEIIKSNTEIQKEIGDIVDSINKEKEEIEQKLQFIDSLEEKYFNLVEQAKRNNIKK